MIPVTPNDLPTSKELSSLFEVWEVSVAEWLTNLGPTSGGCEFDAHVGYAADLSQYDPAFKRDVKHKLFQCDPTDSAIWLMAESTYPDRCFD